MATMTTAHSADDQRIQTLLADWHADHREAYRAQLCREKWTPGHRQLCLDNFDRDQAKRATNRQKYIALDEGSSGVWLVDRQSGDVYHIKSKYGVPDKSKHLGNIDMITATELCTYRWWYRR